MIVEPQVRKFCGPLFFITSEDTPKNTISGNGSFGLVSTRERKLLVTCWHVLQEFKIQHAQNPNSRFGIGFGGKHPVSVALEDVLGMVVDEDRNSDLATFEVSDALDLIAQSHLDFFDLNANRPPKLRVGDILFLIGFPGKGRQENRTSVGFVRQPIGVRASQVGEFSFIAEVQNLKLDQTDYGGISGAPCFVVNEHDIIRLVGFATGFAPGEMNLLQFTYARTSAPTALFVRCR